MIGFTSERANPFREVLVLSDHLKEVCDGGGDRGLLDPRVPGQKQLQPLQREIFMCCIVIEARVGPCLRLCPPFPALSIRRITGCLRILVQFSKYTGCISMDKSFWTPSTLYAFIIENLVF